MSRSQIAYPAESTRSRLGADDGSATLEAAIIAPVLLFATMALIQAVLYFLASTSVTNAAQIALESSRAEAATAANGQQAAQTYLADQSMVTNTTVSVERGAERVEVNATGTAPSLVPFLTLPAVESTIEGPVERVTAP